MPVKLSCNTKLCSCFDTLVGAYSKSCGNTFAVQISSDTALRGNVYGVCKLCASFRIENIVFSVLCKNANIILTAKSWFTVFKCENGYAGFTPYVHNFSNGVFGKVDVSFFDDVFVYRTDKRWERYFACFLACVIKSRVAVCDNCHITACKGESGNAYFSTKHREWIIEAYF